MNTKQKAKKLTTICKNIIKMKTYISRHLYALAMLLDSNAIKDSQIKVIREIYQIHISFSFSFFLKEHVIGNKKELVIKFYSKHTKKNYDKINALIDCCIVLCDIMTIDNGFMKTFESNNENIIIDFNIKQKAKIYDVLIKKLGNCYSNSVESSDDLEDEKSDDSDNEKSDDLDNEKSDDSDNEKSDDESLLNIFPNNKKSKSSNNKKSKNETSESSGDED
jgi:hypothetical protein